VLSSESGRTRLSRSPAIAAETRANWAIIGRPADTSTCRVSQLFLVSAGWSPPDANWSDRNFGKAFEIAETARQIGLSFGQSETAVRHSRASKPLKFAKLSRYLPETVFSMKTVVDHAGLELVSASPIARIMELSV
jgi:hypothetical protein